MQNHISLRPNPAVTSYLRHFQIAQINLSLFIEEEKETKRKKKIQRSNEASMTKKVRDRGGRGVLR